MDDGVHTGTAGSKVILLGEHAVVHGKDALVVGLPDGVTATVRSAAAPGLHVTPWTLDGPSRQLLHSALQQLQNALGAPHEPLHIEVVAAIPSRAGMGASAAVGMAGARAMNRYFSLRRTEDELFDAVLAFEHVFHHQSSGVDIRAVSRPGCALFHPPVTFTPLDCAPVPLMVVHSGEPGATGRTVRIFGDRLNRHPNGPDRLQRLGELVLEGVNAVQGADWPRLGEWMNECHGLLQWFGVSSDRLDRICHLARQGGALGAKLTGGGGGGCAVILAESKIRTELCVTFEAEGFKVVR